MEEGEVCEGGGEDKGSLCEGSGGDGLREW